jgi:hypothetical protein
MYVEACGNLINVIASRNFVLHVACSFSYIIVTDLGLPAVLFSAGQSGFCTKRTVSGRNTRPEAKCPVLGGSENFL